MLGTTNGQDPAARAAPGVCEQLTYIHWMNAEVAAPGVYRPIQSVALGLGMPLQVAVSVPRRATVVGLALSVTPPSLSVIVSTAVLGLPSVAAARWTAERQGDRLVPLHEGIVNDRDADGLVGRVASGKADGLGHGRVVRGQRWRCRC